MLTEARVAILISVLAASATIWQALEATRANRFAEESLRIDVHSKFAEDVNCFDAKHPLSTNWTVVVYNTSRHPIQIRLIRTAPVKSPNPQQRSDFIWHEVRNEVVPVRLEPSSHQVFEVVGLFSATQIQRLRADALCTPERESRERQQAEANRSSSMPFRLKLGLEKRLVLPKVIDKGQFGLQVQVETTTGRLHNGFGHIYDVDLSAEF